MGLVSLDLRMAPGRIHFLKFIIEGYDGLAMLSTVDPQLGHVRLRFSTEAEGEVCDLLDSVARQLGRLEYLR